MKIVHKLAWSFSRTTPHDRDELERVAVHAYRVARSKWSSNGGSKLTSWVYTCVQNELIKYCKTYDTQMELKPELLGAAPKESDMVDRLTDLSDSAFEVAAMVLDNEEEVVHANAHITRMRISKILREEKQWANQDIALAFLEIRQKVCCG